MITALIAAPLAYHFAAAFVVAGLLALMVAVFADRQANAPARRLAATRKRIARKRAYRAARKSAYRAARRA